MNGAQFRSEPIVAFLQECALPFDIHCAELCLQCSLFTVHGHRSWIRFHRHTRRIKELHFDNIILSFRVETNVMHRHRLRHRHKHTSYEFYVFLFYFYFHGVYARIGCELRLNKNCVAFIELRLTECEAPGLWQTMAEEQTKSRRIPFSSRSLCMCECECEIWPKRMQRKTTINSKMCQTHSEFSKTKQVKKKVKKNPTRERKTIHVLNSSFPQSITFTKLCFYSSSSSSSLSTPPVLCRSHRRTNSTAFSLDMHRLEAEWREAKQQQQQQR